MAMEKASPKPLIPSEEEEKERQHGPVPLPEFRTQVPRINSLQISLGSPASTDELIQSIRGLVAQSPPGLRICFRWPAAHVENLHANLSQVHDISDCLSRFEYDYESNTVSLTMGESRGHAYLGGCFGSLIQQKLELFTMTAGVPGEVAIRVMKVMALYTARVQVKEKLWYQPDGSFVLMDPPAAQTTVVYEVS